MRRDFAIAHSCTVGVLRCRFLQILRFRTLCVRAICGVHCCQLLANCVVVSSLFAIASNLAARAVHTCVSAAKFPACAAWKTRRSMRAIAHCELEVLGKFEFNPVLLIIFAQCVALSAQRAIFDYSKACRAQYPETETTKRNSSALSSTTCTTRTMYFSSNRRAGATVMTDAGAALQKASDVPADCRVSLTPDKFAALRVDSAGQVLLQTMPCDEITVATNYLASAQLVAWRTALALHCRSRSSALAE